MKRSKRLEVLLPVLILLAVLLFTACRSKGSDDGGNTSGENPSVASPSDSAPLSYNPNEITMAVWLYRDYSLKTDTYMDAAALLYEEKTGIKVNTQNHYVSPVVELIEISDSGGNYWTGIELEPSDTSIYVERTLTELMAGTGADIYDVSFMDFDQLGKNGLLMDLGGLFEGELGVNNDTHFRDIVLSGKTDNGIFAVPLDFYLRKLVTTNTDEELLDNKRRTWQEFMEEISELDYKKSVAYWDTDLEIFMERFVSRVSDFIDEDGNTQSLYSEDMIALLEECREWGDIGLCHDSRDPSSIACAGSYIGGGDISQPARQFCTLPEGYKRGYGGFVFAPMPFDGDPVISVDGSFRYPEICGPEFYGVNAGSPKAEIAQEFLRFLLSEEGQDKMVSWNPGPHNGLIFPVNRVVFRNYIEHDLERIKTSFKDLNVPALLSEAEDTVDQIAYIITGKPYYRTIIREVAKEFFLGQISAEEAARQMSDKVSLYLKERG